MVEVECGRGPAPGWSEGSGSRGLWAVLDRPVTNVSCPWSHLLLKSRDVPFNLFNLCSLGQRTSLFLPGWASWILCEPQIGEKHGCQWIFRRICLARGYDSFENPGLTSPAFALSACAPSNYSWKPGDTGQLSDTCPAKWVGSYPWGVHTMSGGEQHSLERKLRPSENLGLYCSSVIVDLLVTLLHT